MNNGITIKLTPAEEAFFVHLMTNCGNGYATKEAAEYLLRDNYSWFDATHLIGVEYNKNQVGGFMSSLQEKGIIGQDREDWWVTDFGVKVALETLPSGK